MIEHMMSPISPKNESCMIKHSPRFALQTCDKLRSHRISQEKYVLLMKYMSVHTHAIHNRIDKNMRLAEHGYE